MEFPNQLYVEHWNIAIKNIAEFKEYLNIGSLQITGNNLTISQLCALTFKSHFNCSILDSCCEKMTKNNQFFQNLIDTGKIIYGANTGYGGSANVRYNKADKTQEYLISHLKAGFGRKTPVDVIRG